MLGFLATAGHVGLIGSGARLLLAGVEHATGLPVYSSLRNVGAQMIGDVRSLASPMLNALGGPQLARFADPAFQYRTVGDPRHALAGTMTLQEYANKQARLRKKAEEQLAAEHAAQAQAEAQRVLDEANAKASAAEQRAAQAEAALKTEQDQAKRRNLKFGARAARRWATASRAFSGQANAAASKAAANPTEANFAALMDLALKSLSTAQAAMTPPQDARHVLADDNYSPAEKSAAQYAIDAVNRDDDFDVNAVLARLSSDDAGIRESAEDELQDAADLAGPDAHDGHGHGHGHGHGAGGCGCGGKCGGKGGAACSAKAKAKPEPLAGAEDDDPYAYDSTEPVAVAGADDGDGEYDYDSTPEPAEPDPDGSAWEASDDDDEPADDAAALAGAEDDDPYAYDATPTAAQAAAADRAFRTKLEKLAGPDEDEDCGCAG